MQRIWHLLRKEGNDPLGNSLFETYPAACLELMGVERKGYKGQVVFGEDTWQGAGAEAKNEQKKNDKLARILNRLKWSADVGTVLGHDAFDAAICFSICCER